MQYAYSDDNMTTPYWKMDRIYNETILMISENGEPANGKLLFQPKKILRVSDYTLKNEYKEGVDYTVDGNKLTVTENSSIPSLTQAQLYGENIPEDLTTFAGRNGHDKVLFTMGVGISMRQICVSYTYDNSQYEGPKPAYSETELPKTIAKLKAGEPIKFVVNGDSVSVGGDCSGKIGRRSFHADLGTADRQRTSPLLRFRNYLCQ